jgi:hypothetical protein
MLTVFLSSTSKDLEQCREAAFRAIEGLHGNHCIRMEDFGSIDEAPDDFCRKKVGECDLFVCIAGPLYGSRSPAGASFTEREFDAAILGKKQCLVFMTAENYPLAADLIEADEERKCQLAFRQKVSKGRMITRFSTADEVSFKVVQAIRNWEAERAGNPAPCQEVLLMSPEERDADIARRAYAIWEEEGQPRGRDLDHWLRAEDEFYATQRARRAALSR